MWCSGAAAKGLSAAVFYLVIAYAASGCATATQPPVSVAATVFSSPSNSAPHSRLLIDIPDAEEGFTISLEAEKCGELDAAERYARGVIEQHQGTVWQKRALFLLGRILIAQDRTVEAAEVLLRVPAENPVLGDYALFLLADHYASKKQHTEAVQLFERLTVDYPVSMLVPRAILRKAQVLENAGLLSEAALAFEQVLRNYSQSDAAVDAGFGLGRVRAEMGDLAGAARAYLDVAVRRPEAGRDRELEAALDDIRAKGFDVPKLTADELYERGKALFRAGQYEKAHESFSKALEADPSYYRKSDAMLKSGIALYNLGRRPAAAAAFERLLRAKYTDCRCAEALLWLGKSYSRLGMREEAVNAFLRLVNSFPESEWADDALYLAGNAERDGGDIKKAIRYYRRLVTEYPESSFADSGLWWEAWAAYMRGEYRESMKILKELIRAYPRSFLVNQALYWEGRAAEKTGDQRAAAASYRRLLLNGPYTYYGYRAAERLSMLELPAATVAADSVFTEGSSGTGSISDYDNDGDAERSFGEDVRSVSSNPVYRKVFELMYIGMKYDASLELRRLIAARPLGPDAIFELSRTFFELEDYHNSLVIVLRSFDRLLDRPSSRLPDDLRRFAYPLGFWPAIAESARKYGIDPYFVAALIREESQFRVDALSPAGARGVMQVMPSTGEWIARSAGLAGFDSSQLFHAEVNIAVGTWYVAHLLKKFGGNIVLAAAAYNAGPEPVAAWTEKNSIKDMDVFVESIPYAETRAYVKKVLRNYAEYRRLYGLGDTDVARR